MATLEIHDRGKQVRRVQISHENPVMFGSDPMCDVILDGPGIQPFHGRIRWKGNRFKVDASPDVPWIELNGIQVKSKSIRQGDEIRVGHCRIFLLSVEDGPDHGEKTVVRERPNNPTPPPARSAVRPAKPAAEFHRMEMAPPSVESAVPVPTARDDSPKSPFRRKKFRGSNAFEDESVGLAGVGSVKDLLKEGAEAHEEVEGLTALSQDRPARKGLFGRFLPPLERAPGDDRVMGSPLVTWLAISFVLLVALSFGLWKTITRATASRQFNVATQDMESGNFLNAIKGFDQFLVTNPEDRRANKAKVLRALARVRQHTGSVGASWGNALIEAQAMVDEVGQLEEYRDSNLDLAEDLRKTAEGLADRAADLADSKILAEAENTVQLHASVAGPAASSLFERSRIPAKFDKARAAIRKSYDRVEAIAQMDAALKANKPAEAYSARDRLVHRYPDLGNNQEITTRMVQANEQIRAAVTFDPSGRPGETEPHAGQLGPPTSLVLRLDPGRTPARAKDPVAYAFADGLLYGVDAGTGAPRWQVDVGEANPFPPLAVAGDPPTVITVDSRSNELIRLDGRTGALIWRQELGGRVLDAPLILGNQLFQPTSDGRLLQIDLATGSVRGILQLGRRLATTPVADDSVQHLYLLADEDCLFVIGLDPLACVAVEYIGQEAGAVACPPARVGRFFVLPENQGIDQGRWRVFVIDEQGTKLREVQELPIGGWNRATPAASGPVIWSCSDRGELIAYAIGLYDAKTPFAPIARVAPGLELEGPAFPKAKSDREFWLASSRSGRFELDLERGRFSPTWTLGEAGPALAPPQAFDRLLVLTQQYADGPGTALWGVETASGRVRWRTVLGSRWTLPLLGSTSTDALSTLAADGRNFSISLDSLKAGGFIEQPLPKPGGFRVPTTTTQRLEIDGTTVIVPEAGSSRVLVGVGSGEFRTVELPAPLATSAVALGKNLLVPGADGRVYLVDPRTGGSAADPYVPPFDRSKPIRWRSPVTLEGEAVALADSEATLRRISVDTKGRPRLIVTSELKLDKPLEADPASTGSSILIATADGKVRSLASRDLGPQGSWPLEATRLVGPVVVADHAFVADSAGNVLAFSPDGRRLWSAKLRDTIAAGAPAILDQSAWFLGRDGSVQRFDLANGAPQSRTVLEILPADGALAAGPELVVPSGRGTVRILDRQAIATLGGPKP